MAGELFNTDKEQRVAVLLNVPGQTYIVGSEFREGSIGLKTELILMVGVDPIHCRILVNEGGEFLLDNCVNGKKSKTRLNGRLIRKTVPFKLNFGDTLTFRKVECRFQERTYRRDEDEKAERDMKTCADMMTSIIISSIFKQAGQRYPTKRKVKAKKVLPVPPAVEEGVELPWDVAPGILPTILSFLSVPDLRRCRLVSKYWREETTPILQKKSKVHWDFTEEEQNADALQIFRYTQDMKNWNPQALVIKFPTSYYNFAKMNKLNDDLKRYKFALENLLQGVRSLSIQPVSLIPQSQRSDNEPFWARICLMLAPWLEELQLESIEIIDAFVFSPQFPESLKRSGFPKLKIFKTNSSLDDEDDKSGLLVPWTRALAKAVQKVEYLDLGSFFESRILLAAFTAQHKFMNLSTLQMNINAGCSGALGVWKDKVATPLKKIIIGVAFDADYSIALKDLHALIKKHAKSLEVLSINLDNPCHINDSDEDSDSSIGMPWDEDSNQKTFNWPGALPNLKKLILAIHDEIDVSFEGDRIQYNELLPKLQSLRITLPGDDFFYHPDWEDTKDGYTVGGMLDRWDLPLLEVFFPEDADEVLPSLVELEIPHADEDQIDADDVDPEIKKEYQRRLKTIAGMFPNVKNNWLEEARTWN